jgi:hypothetical protein
MIRQLQGTIPRVGEGVLNSETDKQQIEVCVKAKENTKLKSTKLEEDSARVCLVGKNG